MHDWPFRDICCRLGEWIEDTSWLGLGAKQMHYRGRRYSCRDGDESPSLRIADRVKLEKLLYQGSQVHVAAVPGAGWKIFYRAFHENQHNNFVYLPFRVLAENFSTLFPQLDHTTYQARDGHTAWGNFSTENG